MIEADAIHKADKSNTSKNMNSIDTPSLNKFITIREHISLRDVGIG